MIVFGSGMYGRVDQIPGICEVRTRFGHIYWAPLIPLGSFVIFEQSGDGFHGASIPLSGKSILVAWLRAACVIGGVALIIAAAIGGSEGKIAEPVALGLASVGLAGLFIFLTKSRFVNIAGYQRAVQLADHIGLSPEGRLMIEVVYKRLTPEQADAELEKIESLSAAAHNASTDSPTRGDDLADTLKFPPPGG